MFVENYSEMVINHFMCPRNVGIIKNANGVGTIGDPDCGDSLSVYIRVQNNTIEDISFKVFGCPASIATSSMTTVLVKGKKIEEALKLTEEDIVKALGGLPEKKVHCSNLGVKALKIAINNYLENTDV